MVLGLSQAKKPTYVHCLAKKFFTGGEPYVLECYHSVIDIVNCKLPQESDQLCLACFLDTVFMLAHKPTESLISRSSLFSHIININVQTVVKLLYG